MHSRTCFLLLSIVSMTCPCVKQQFGFLQLLLHAVPLHDSITISFISSAVGDHLGCFMFGAIRNKGATTIGMHVSWWPEPSLPLATHPGMLATDVCELSCTRHGHTVFQCCATSPINCQCTGAAAVPCHCHTRCQSFFILAILMGMQSYLIIGLIGIFLLANNVGHLSQCLLVSSFPLLQASACFSVGV